jgi:hypothetical protein
MPIALKMAVSLELAARDDGTDLFGSQRLHQ